VDYCLPQSYQARLEPDEVVAEDDQGFWQPDVYVEAAAIAKRLGARRLVDVGCGSGQRLAALHPGFEIVGIDNSANIAGCRERYDFGTWLEVDLDSDNSLGVVDLTGSVLVCANLIEQLVEPERLLALVSDALDKGAAALVLSTPDRDLMNEAGHLGPPASPTHVREWTRAELERFMASAGLTGHFGLTRWSELTPSMRTILAVLPGRSAEQHDVVRDWWEERARWQRLVEEHDRTIAQQQTWTGELRTEKDWLAQQRAAWEATALEKEAGLLECMQRIAELEAALAAEHAQVGALEASLGRTSVRWALRPARRLVQVARRSRLRR